jgi:hypothetical protein
VQNRLGEVQSAILSPVDMMKKFLNAPPAVAPPGAEPETELEGLRKRIAELESRLEKPVPKKKRRKRVNR